MGLFACSEPELQNPEGNLPSGVEGYTDKSSYDVGETLIAYISSNTNNSNGRYRLFDVLGNVVDEVHAPLSKQAVSSASAWENGFEFSETFQYKVPSNLKSGIYLWENEIPFVIKSDNVPKILILHPSNTVNAYTESGGRSLYSKSTPIVSFHRPQNIYHSFAMDFYKWLAEQPYDCGYLCDRDLDNSNLLADAEILLIPGHSEYWTRAARQTFDEFVNSGGHAIVLSGNTMWWQVRYEDNKLICYKSLDLDPILDKSLTTYLWNSPELNYPILQSIGADFDRGGYGLRSDDGWDGYKIIQPLSPLLEGTELKTGDVISLPSLEYDGVPISGYDSHGFPVVDNDLLGFNKIQLIGFDFGFRGQKTVGTFFAFQKVPDSGIIIHAGSIGWCISTGIGSESHGHVKKITKNMIDKLSSGQSVFAP